MSRSCVKILDTVVFGIPRTASSSHTVSHRSVDCSPYMFNTLRCSACSRSSRIWITFSRFSTIFEVFVPHFNLHYTHCILPKILENHLNSFRWGIFKLGTKFDADSLLYSLSHFECDGHTVHTLTQWHLLLSMTGTVKSSSFMHAHCSTFSLAARLHQYYTNHSCYINNGWTFSRQISCVCVCVCVTHRHRQQYADRGKRGFGEMEEAKGGLNGDRKTLLGQWMHDAVCRWCFVELYTLEIYMVLWTNVTPINSINF